MAEQVGLLNIAKLSGENWITWKFQVQIALKSKGYFGIVEGTTGRPIPPANTQEWDNKDAKAQEIIVSRLDEKVIKHVLTCKSSAEMWAKLKNIYEHQSQVSVHLLTQRFFTLEYTEGNVTEFISQLEEIKGTLKTLGEEVSDKMIITKVLMSLPENMKYFVSAWESTPDNKQTLTELLSRLMLEEERNKGSEKAQALAASFKTRQIKHNKDLKCFQCNGNHMKRDCPQRVCNFCKKPGHLMEKCWFKKRKNGDHRNGPEGSRLFHQALISKCVVDIMSVIEVEEVNKHNWWMDSGATEHMCYDENQFIEMETLAAKKQVKVGDGTLVEVKGKGTVQLLAFNGNNWVRTDLLNVLFVPELAVNLFSLSTSLDKGFEMFSDKNKCEILDKEGKTRAIARRRGKLFRMEFKIEGQEMKKHESQCNVVMNLNEWHERLAHVNFEQTRKVLKRNNIKFEDQKEPFCSKCLSGKQHRLHFPESTSRAQATCELIHGDLCGPLEVESLGRAKYMLTLKDDYSNFRKVYFLKNKSETEKKIEHFVNWAENMTGNKIKMIRTDNGLEFINRKVQDICDSRGIVHQKSCAYSPQQNGRAERENRSIMELVRTMLHGSGLPKDFWAEAANAAVFTLNRVGSSPQDNRSPYELWYNKEFKIEFLRAFGSKVSVHVPKQKRLKLDAKNLFGIFVGYSEEVKGYRVYLTDKGDVEIHRDVVFMPENCETKLRNSEIKKKNAITSLSHPDNQELVGASLEDSLDDFQHENNTQEDVFEDVQGANESVNEVERSISSEDEEKHIRQAGRQGKRPVKQPVWMQDYEIDESDICFYTENEEPIDQEEAMSGKHSAKWKEAIEKELKVLKDNNTWTEVPWPKGQKVIDSKWVFKIKSDGQFKARLVARGFQQELSKEMYDLYAPVAKLCTFRVLLAMANHYGMAVHQMDVQSAFLYGDIEEEVFMTFPGQNVSDKVYKLNKSIYGLKKSPKYWNTKFDNLMIKESFERSENDFCVYSKTINENRLFVLIYVDDVLIIGFELHEILKIKLCLCRT